jgi:hypothetical protein
VITLTSSNPAVATAPASATVAAGATSVNFAVSTLACTSGSATLSAGYAGATKSAGLTVTSTADIITIQQADYSANKRELSVSARSTNAAAILRAYVSSSGQLIGRLRNLGDGRNNGQFTWSVNPQSIMISSSACGSATSVVNSKRW